MSTDSLSSAPPAPVLEFDAVDFVRSGRPILREVSFTVRAGEHWALIGPNGAGKSTILSICGATAHPTRGTATVLGHRLGTVDLRALKHSIGHVNPRHPLSSPLTVFEVVLTGETGSNDLVPRWSPEPAVLARAEELITALGLRPIRDAVWPNLSQGERGRALIARALLPDPEILLLDEPTTGLDVAARERFLRTVDDLHHTHPDLATVLVTHHLEELPVSTTHAMLIGDGRLLAAGDAADVLTTENVSAAFDYPIEISRHDGRWQARAV
ncbi:MULTISPECIES: ABC transporter ATP-binding protein [unclassified Gordonia (in: high G+C Gram-positive bacteria)]|uniref:ABC transporter ATP-binding protein n=1 Tax=unclassified Gordonia (in: high G+C Gram-positive bacteria) TaxID=2657482 RepID=UPI001FFE5B7C|nr:ATP-binding cassette domain-containing protein [Gordonia sp. PP30]UQE76670.1 ATP-binding cassette domain-containing protein [Gordonia sp. PP30]